MFDEEEGRALDKGLVLILDCGSCDFVKGVPSLVDGRGGEEASQPIFLGSRLLIPIPISLEEVVED